MLTGNIHANDDNFHGTHVASTIAEATNNGVGVTGLAFGFFSFQEESKRAPWGLVLEEPFASPDSSLRFHSYDRMQGAWVPSQSCKVARGRLEAFSTGQSFAVGEMLVGQLFLVTAVAKVVSTWRPGRGGGRPPAESDSD